MPPKGASKKTVEKAKQKTVDDKTFGLKNKNKSKKVNAYVKQVTNQVKGGPKTGKMETDKFEDRQKKKEEEERKKFEEALFKPTVQQAKIPIGVDPKSIVCEYFKIGKCTKGDKCKFAHNLDAARKTAKIDVYTDRRALEEDTMDKWDQSKLEKVVESKKGTGNKTDIVCKYFIEAIENKKYGWFWDCPNGGDECKYQHCLPPGFVLKSSNKEEKDDEDDTPLEDILEEERAKLTKRTPVTLELFLKWREDKKKEKETKAKEDKEKKDAEAKTGRSLRSGRELFTYNPNMAIDDDDDNVMDINELEPEEKSEGPIINLDVSGTSIRTTITNNDENGNEDDPNIGQDYNPYEDNGKEEVDENLFVEEEIPDEPDE